LSIEALKRFERFGVSTVTLPGDDGKVDLPALLNT
jgi:hypothetical protein